MKPSELIAKPENWTKEVFSGRNNKDELCYCLLGAIAEIYRGEARNWTVIKLNSKMHEKYPGMFMSIVDFNDDPQTQHEDVLNLLKECDL